MFRQMSARAVILSAERRPALLLGFAGFVLVGVAYSLFGPSFPHLRLRFGVGVDEVGLVVSAQFIGAAVTMLVSGLLLGRFGYRPLMVAGAAVMALGAVGVAFAPSWSLILVAAFAGGLGSGTLVICLNLLTARVFVPASAPALNLMNAMFGIGAISGPLLVAAAAPRQVVPFLLLAVLAMAVSVGALFVKAPVVERPPGAATGFAWGPLVGFALVYLFYVATEVGITAWETEHLSPLYGTAAAAAFTSLYWMALTVGRVLAIPLSARIAPGRLVAGSLALTLLFLLFAHLVRLAPLFYALAGLSLAPVFGTALAWFTLVFKERSEQLAPVMLAVANFGPITTAPLIGVAVATWGYGVIPTALSLLAAGAALAAGWLLRRTRG